MVVRAGFRARERLLADHPDTFGVPPRFESHMMVVVELEHADPQAVADVPIDHFDGFDTWQDLPRDGRCVRDYWF